MKTYYDLKDKELKDYRKEFRKTEQGKKIYYTKILLNICFILATIGLFSSGYLSASANNPDSYSQLISDFDRIFTFIAIVDVIFELYFGINFSSWLKNKHQINRW